MQWKWIVITNVCKICSIIQAVMCHRFQRVTNKKEKENIKIKIKIANIAMIKAVAMINH